MWRICARTTISSAMATAANASPTHFLYSFMFKRINEGRINLYWWIDSQQYSHSVSHFQFIKYLEQCEWNAIVRRFNSIEIGEDVIGSIERRGTTATWTHDHFVYSLMNWWMDAISWISNINQFSFRLALCSNQIVGLFGCYLFT